jgi:hypothetical protein
MVQTWVDRVVSHRALREAPSAAKPTAHLTPQAAHLAETVLKKLASSAITVRLTRTRPALRPMAVRAHTVTSPVTVTPFQEALAEIAL